MLAAPSMQVWDNEKVVLIPDHYIFTSDPRANRNVDILREMAHKYNIKYFYDIQDRSNFKANPDYKGRSDVRGGGGVGWYCLYCIK
jgi:3-isopropylmalate/(R)-2-methylmalate dehydratase large subunit